MAAKIIWAPSGLDDLGSAVANIAADNLRAAVAFGQAVIDRTHQLSAFTDSGRFFANSVAGEIRETVLGKYRLLYRVSTDKKVVTILRIWHGARGHPEIPGS